MSRNPRNLARNPLSQALSQPLATRHFPGSQPLSLATPISKDMVAGPLASPPKGDTLADLARQVERLSPCHRDPERFHLDKSVIAETLRRMAEQVRNR
jgi:hypothetical protein